MSEKPKQLLILERSSQNLRKISKDGKTILEGVFAEFGIENRNGRIYEEKEYLPHLEYLKKDMANGNLLGELDHPERFEVALSGVSHRISELWYDQGKRQILGRVEILDGTPKGVIAKSLLDAGVPLSISSRAAGSVNEDKTVSIQQIYTYDLVAKPGFESAELHAVNESANSRIKSMLESLNESFNKHKKDNINNELGIVNENISIIDVTDKFPSVKLREEAKSLIQKNNERNMKETNVNEEVVQEWTVKFNDELIKLNERLDNIENTILENGGTISDSGEIKTIKEYIEKIRKIQESAVNWQSDIAKAVNKVGNHATKHYNLTKKIVETVDYNAKTLNATQDWVGANAEVLNGTCETVDHNANMLDKINEWTTQIAKSVNKLNEWGEEKAVAINDMHEWVSDQSKTVNSIHEWTSSIAKNLNHTANYAEDMFGRAMSKDDAKKLIEYVELVAESKKNEKLKNKIDEMLTKHSITNEKINEATLKPLQVLDTDTVCKTIGNTKVGDLKKKDSGVNFDSETGTIIAKQKTFKLKKGSKPKELKVLDTQNPTKILVGKSGKGLLVLDATKSIGKGKESVGGDGPSDKHKSDQNLKLDQKPSGKLKETVEVTKSIKTRSSKLDEKLSKIIENLEKERENDEKVKTEYPFTILLSETDRKRFAGLSKTDKQKVSQKIVKVPTTETEVILKLWENALGDKKPEEPRWLELAPKDYKKLYNEASEDLKEAINARSEFYNLFSEYQIINFWENSGLDVKPTVVLNENVTANSKKSTENVDPIVAQVAEQMKRFNY